MSAASPNEKVRWRALYLISDGESGANAARRVGRTSGSITQLTQRFNRQGPQAVPDHQGEIKVGPQPCVNAELARELDAALREPAPDGGLWTAPKAVAWIKDRTGKEVHETTAWRAIRRLGFTLQTPRPKHKHSASAEEQEAFKKSSLKPSQRSKLRTRKMP